MIYIGLHAIQGFAASCVNRGEDNSPKTVVFGGETRARWSSQSMKRIMRSMMKDGGLEISQNSRHHIDEIYHLVGVESNDAKQTVQTVYSVFMSEKAKKEKTAPKVEKAENTDSDQPEKVEKKTKAGFDLGAMMTRMSRDQHIVLANVCKKYLSSTTPDAKQIAKDVKSALENYKDTFDVLAFGRFMASDAFNLNTDSAVEVAHAISTHKITDEQDFFTAVDDIQEDSAGHLDSRGFNAPVFYRYMSINVDMLKGRTIEEIRQLIKSFLYLVPTAMRSSFASDQRASFALLTCGEGNSTSLANAFSKSVRSGNNDILSASADKLISHYKKQKKAWGEVANESMFAIDLNLTESIDNVQTHEVVNDAIESILSQLQRLGYAPAETTSTIEAKVPVTA